MNRQNSPSQRRWECRRENSDQITRRYSARSGTSIFMICFDALAVGCPVDETADPAGPLGDIDVFGEFPLLHELLETPVDIPDGRDDIHDLLVLKDEVEVDRLRQDRVLRPERDDDLFAHGLSPFVTVTGGWLNGNFTAVRIRVPLKSMFMPRTWMPKRSCISFS